MTVHIGIMWGGRGTRGIIAPQKPSSAQNVEAKPRRYLDHIFIPVIRRPVRVDLIAQFTQEVAVNGVVRNIHRGRSRWREGFFGKIQQTIFSESRGSADFQG